MHPPGQAEVDRARADGRWEAAYDGAKTATVPDDLTAALTADPAAAEFFETLDRHAILYRVQDAKKAETRARGEPLGEEVLIARLSLSLVMGRASARRQEPRACPVR